MKDHEKLQLVQKISGLTQEQLASKLGVSFVTLNSWINARSIPRVKKQVLINELYTEYTGSKVVPETLLQAKKDLIISKGKLHKHILETISGSPDLFDQFTLSLTYNTNSIEGSTLTEHETADILFRNVSVRNKSVTEHLEAKNHQTALRHLFGYLPDRHEITESLVLKLHALLMNSIREDAGCYRNHGVRIVGANIPTANYLKVPVLMHELVHRINATPRDVIAHVAEVHSTFEQIHPFSDGNGRIGRLLIHAMLLRANLPPAIILQTAKRSYMTYLNKAQQSGDTTLLQDFLCDAVLLGFEVIEGR